MASEFTDLSLAWRDFFADGRVSPGLRPMVLEAWKRSLGHGNSPGQIKAQPLDPARLAMARQRSHELLAAADPVIAEMQSALRDRLHAIVLLNEEGIVLRLRLHPDLTINPDDSNAWMFEGASWLEKNIGCNGAGTALALGKPVVFIGPEHFSPQQAGITCIGVPIRSPGGEVCGAISMSVPNAEVDVDTWGWALSVASRLEESLAGRTETNEDCQALLGSRRLDDPLNSIRGVMDFLIQELYLTPTHEKLVSQARDRLDQAEDRLAHVLRDLDDSQDHLAAALQASEVKSIELQTVFDTIDSAVFVVEEPSHAITANRAGLDLLGLDSPEDLKDGFERIIDGLQVFRENGLHPLSADPLWADTLRRDCATNVPARIRNLKGHEVDVLVTLRSIGHPEGRPRRQVITVRDVTTIRSLERAKDEYLQVLSHELRNPLAAAYGLIQLISKRLPTDHGQDIAGYLKIAESELRRLNTLLTDILTGYRVSSGRLPLDLMPLDLTEVLCEATAPYAGPDQERSLTLDITDGPVYILGDRQRLLEVMANLLSNATKYSAAGSEIRVSSIVGKHQVTVKVEDEGVGIPPDQLEKVFDGFYRATNLSNRQPGGIGLGLYISRDIARRHGGHLWAENRPDKGTVMSLRLPLVSGLSPSWAGAGATTEATAPKMNACGAYCGECTSARQKCSGCAVVKGKPYWSLDVLTKTCPLYRCSTERPDGLAKGSGADIPCGNGH